MLVEYVCVAASNVLMVYVCFEIGAYVYGKINSNKSYIINVTKRERRKI